MPAPSQVRRLARLRRLAANTEAPDTLPTPDLPEARLLRRCGPALRDVLQGRADPLDLLFGDGGALAAALYAASPFARAVNAIAAAALGELLQGRPPARILEIGCGTGGTTRALLPCLRPGDTWQATDISPGFVTALRREFAIPGAVLDIARDPAAQGFVPAAADIVVAANVLHATPSLRATLAHVAALLAPGGALLLVENAGELAWGELTFGLTDGMDAFADPELRSGHALPAPEAWAALLRAEGFEVAIHQPGDAATACVSGQFVLVARHAPAARRIWHLAHGPAPDDATDLVWTAPPGRNPGPRQGALPRRAEGALRAGPPPRAEPLEPIHWGQGAKGPLWVQGGALAGPQGRSPAMGQPHSRSVLPDAVLPDTVPALLDAAFAQFRAAAARPVPPRLWIATTRARAVLPGEAPDLAQAALWGAANAVAIEHPELRLTLLDLDDPAALPALVAAGGAETRLAVRDGIRLQARLERIPAPAPAPPPPPDATCLITGGLAGIGLAVARHLAGRGARHIALAGRTLHDPGAFPPGTRVTTHRCDVADAAQLTALLAELAATHPPLGSIFHAAGVLDDALLAQQTPDRIARVLAPKLTGALLLDRLTRSLPITHFVLFSSSAALLGAAGQANHAAANAALDALAERRRAEGLPALSIAWGAWGEIGAAARAGAAVARRGLLPMPPAEALAAFEAALGAADPVVGVLDVDWPRFLDRFPAGGAPPVFAGLRLAAPAGPVCTAAATPAAPPALAAALQAVPPDERAALLLARIRATVARILGLPPGTLPPPDAPLRELGLDSLMTVELRNALAGECAARLPATLVFEHPTCDALAACLAAGPLAALMTAGVTDVLDGLDEAELAALLDQELGGAETQLKKVRPGLCPGPARGQWPP